MEVGGGGTVDGAVGPLACSFGENRGCEGSVEVVERLA